MKVKNRFKKLRKYKGLTAQEVADQTGVSRTTIVNCENNKHAPQMSIALKLAEFFGARFEDCFEDLNQGKQEK